MVDPHTPLPSSRSVYIASMDRTLYVDFPKDLDPNPRLMTWEEIKSSLGLDDPESPIDPEDRDDG